MDHQLLINILAYLGAAVIAVPLFRKLGLGAILGYLVAGAIIGPEGIHLIDHPENALHFAEFGVVMLLFIIGLELNPEKLWRMRAHVTLLGGGQLLLSACLIAAFIISFTSFDIQIAILLGLTLGLSSTAFAVQLMDEHGIMACDLGRKGFAILLLQDLAVIPVLLLVSFLAPTASQETSGFSWWMGPSAIIACLLIGRFAINPILTIVAQYGSREVLTAAALLIVLGNAVLMLEVGLSMGMGAFLAGIILANSSYRHQLETDIEPFKGLLLGLFFIAVGMTLDLALLFSQPIFVISLALLLIASKTIIIMGLAKLFGANLKDGLLLGLMLSQGGEFAFVVMNKALLLDLIPQSLSNLIVLIVGISMALTSPLVILFEHLTKEKRDQQRSFDTENTDEAEVIIAGFGRFGQIIGRLLWANDIHFTAMDKDPTHVDFVKRFGNQIFYGDAKRMDLLEIAGIKKARVFVIAVDDIEESLTIAKIAKTECPNLKIVARAHNRMHVYQLMALGVESINREMFESSLLAAKDTLMAIGYTESQAIGKVDMFRHHDLMMLEKAAAHKDDIPKLISIAKEGRKELEDLFKQDHS